MILFFLLIILGINTLFINNYSFFQKVISIRNEYIIKHSTSNIILNFKESRWNSFQNKKEIFYNNKFYDVKKVSKINNVVYACVIEDDFEKNIKDYFHFIAKKNKKESKYSLKLKISFYIILKQTAQIPLLFFEIKNMFNYFLLKKYSNYNYPLTKPPIF